MQDIRTMTPDAAAQTQIDHPPRVISWEMIAYVVIAGLALVFTLSQLGSAPLNDAEARQALAAWRYVSPEAPGSDLTPASPLLFVVQSLAFSLLGSSETAARIATALAGVALALTPALFRRALGTPRALLLSALFACSPVVLIAARSSSPAVWSALLAVLTIWAGWHYEETRKNSWAIAALTLFALLVFTSEPGGVVTAITLFGAVIVAHLTAPLSIDEDDPFEIAPNRRILARLRTFPWLTAAPVAALVTTAVATLFLLYPQGLAAVGDLLTRTLTGLTTRAAGTAPAYPLLISFFYDSWLWILAIGVVIWMARKHRPAAGFADRLGLAWLLLGAIAALIYGGAGAEHALWLTVPLAILVSRLALTIFMPDQDAPGWARWLVALVGLGLLAMGSLAFQGVARSIVRYGSLSFTISQLDALNIVVLAIVAAFAFVGYFLVRSFWENDGVPLKAAAMALLLYALITGVGSAWRTSVTDAGDPLTLWQTVRTASPDVALMRETLFELAERTSKGYSEMPLVIISGGDPLIEWATRDFSEARFVRDYSEAQGAPVVVAQFDPNNPSPVLGGAYLGQDFQIARVWVSSTARVVDLPEWWSQRMIGIPTFLPVSAVVWVRGDIYVGTSTGSAAE